MSKRTIFSKWNGDPKYLREEQPDYHYLKNVFRHLRVELEIEVPKTNKK